MTTVTKKPRKKAKASAPRQLAKSKVEPGVFLYNVAALRARRNAVNRGLSDVAKCAGISADLVKSAYEGKNGLNVLSLWKVAQALKIDWPTMFSESARADGLFEASAEDAASPGPKTGAVSELGKLPVIPDGSCLYNVEAFRAQRRKLRFGERRVAALADVSVSVVRKIYSGGNGILLRNLWSVAKALEINWQTVFDPQSMRGGFFSVAEKDESFKLNGAESL